MMISLQQLCSNQRVQPCAVSPAVVPPSGKSHITEGNNNAPPPLREAARPHGKTQLICIVQKCCRGEWDRQASKGGRERKRERERTHFSAVPLHSSTPFRSAANNNSRNNSSSRNISSKIKTTDGCCLFQQQHRPAPSRRTGVQVSGGHSESCFLTPCSGRAGVCLSVCSCRNRLHLLQECVFT